MTSPLLLITTNNKFLLHLMLDDTSATGRGHCLLRKAETSTSSTRSTSRSLREAPQPGLAAAVNTDAINSRLSAACSSAVDTCGYRHLAWRLTSSPPDA